MSPFNPLAGYFWPNLVAADIPDTDHAPGFFPTSPSPIADVQHAVFGDEYTVSSGQAVQPQPHVDSDSKTPQGLGNVAPLGQRDWGAK